VNIIASCQGQVRLDGEVQCAEHWTTTLLSVIPKDFDTHFFGSTTVFVSFWRKKLTFVNEIFENRVLHDI